MKKIRSFKNSPDGITVNLGKINGGEKINVVPDTVELEVDIRFPPEHDFEEIEGLFSFEADEKEIIHKLEPLSLDPPEQLLEIVKERTICHFATEAVRFYKQVPTVILGPGDPFLAHQIDEYILKKDIERAAEIYEKFAKVPL
ncbi:MAG: M20/M25/M40 family metallo-hydrolase [Euryarchaeota archaeon]|nr:M20/M25/M40 family metallo-hydrolase [Euryarchaeota archaeon]